MNNVSVKNKAQTARKVRRGCTARFPAAFSIYDLTNQYLVSDLFIISSLVQTNVKGMTKDI